MTEAYYRMTVANVPLEINQGATFWQNWTLRFKSTQLPFPLMSDNGTPLWTGRCQFRVNYSDNDYLLELTTGNGGIVLSYNEGNPYYAIMMTDVQTAALPVGKLVYDIEFQRITDNWVIRPQQGKVTVTPEVTK